MGDRKGRGGSLDENTRKEYRQEKCPSLQDMVLSLLSEQLDDIQPFLRNTIQYLPEDLTLKLLSFTLAKGKLDNENAKIFLRCNHESIIKWIKEKVDMFAYVGLPAKRDRKETSTNKAPRKSQLVPMIVPQKVGTREPVIDLLDWIKLKDVTVLNCSPSNLSGRDLFNQDTVIRSDVDMQILVTIPFKSAVHLKAISIDAPGIEGKEFPDMSLPKCVRLYRNRLHMDFDEAQEVTPEMTLNLAPEDFVEGKRMKLKSARFSNVSILTIFIETNQKLVESTHFRRLNILGTPVGGYSSMLSKELKCSTEMTRAARTFQGATLAEGVTDPT
eukprot:CAMPEP_0184492588 /NCGR_PEP_ID=MMETSP0113_2-20130426/23757_1 /TAXON_ID=91329 /ORGANISM="Norrisiella sphaerica, Strain BC52" /LENGTH=328 /DNA_ID=CAMNT_0026877479 /DNA_START=27 /DNA_END=1011 /DNA_ORIENTATION=-